MAKKKTVFARRAWNLLRLALIWARKGGAFKRGLMVELRLLPSYIKSLRHAHGHDSIRYRVEREFSFDETPLFHFKMHRAGSMRFHMPNLPCIKPQVDFDFDFDRDEDDDGIDVYAPAGGRESFLRGEEETEDCDCGEIVALEDEAIDEKADEFIAKFYEQMKLQRQISYLQYTGMLDRGAS